MKERLSVSSRLAAVFVVLVAWLTLIPAAGAQQSTRPSPAAPPARVDIQRLQDTVYDLGSDISRLRSHRMRRGPTTTRRVSTTFATK